MSYILEALKKSERQRRLGAVPRLDTPQEAAPGPVPAARAAWLRPLLLLNLLLVAGLLLYLLLSGPWLDRRVPVGGEKGPQLAAEIDRAEPSSPSPSSSFSSSSAPDPGVGEAAGFEEAGDQGGLAGEASVEAGLAEAEVGHGVIGSPPALLPVPAPLAAGPPPRWSELADGLRERINPPRLEVHVYSETPERRFVMIGGRQYREGDRLPDGLRLEEITPDGVNLSWHGEPFRLAR